MKPLSILRSAKLFVAAALAGFSMQSGTFAQDAGWRELVSRTHGVSVAFPADLIVDESESEQGRFLLEGGAVIELNVSELDGSSLRSFVREHVLELIDVTYRRETPDWMAYSGYRGRDIVYGRTVLSCGGRFAHSFILTYPPAARDTYDRVAERMSLTMRVAPEFRDRNCG